MNHCEEGVNHCEVGVGWCGCGCVCGCLWVCEWAGGCGRGRGAQFLDVSRAAEVCAGGHHRQMLLSSASFIRSSLRTLESWPSQLMTVARLPSWQSGLSICRRVRKVKTGRVLVVLVVLAVLACLQLQEGHLQPAVDPAVR